MLPNVLALLTCHLAPSQAGPRTDLASFQRVSALLPCGLAVLGIFYPHGAVTQLHSRLPALRLSASEEDGVLHGQVAGTEVRDWKAGRARDIFCCAAGCVKLGVKMVKIDE